MKPQRCRVNVSTLPRAKENEQRVRSQSGSPSAASRTHLYSQEATEGKSTGALLAANLTTLHAQPATICCERGSRGGRLQRDRSKANNSHHPSAQKRIREGNDLALVPRPWAAAPTGQEGKSICMHSLHISFCSDYFREGHFKNFHVSLGEIKR